MPGTCRRRSARGRPTGRPRARSGLPCGSPIGAGVPRDLRARLRDRDRLAGIGLRGATYARARLDERADRCRPLRRAATLGDVFAVWGLPVGAGGCSPSTVPSPSSGMACGFGRSARPRPARRRRDRGRDRRLHSAPYELPLPASLSPAASRAPGGPRTGERARAGRERETPRGRAACSEARSGIQMREQRHHRQPLVERGEADEDGGHDAGRRIRGPRFRTRTRGDRGRQRDLDVAGARPRRAAVERPPYPDAQTAAVAAARTGAAPPETRNAAKTTPRQRRPDRRPRPHRGGAVERARRAECACDRRRRAAPTRRPRSLRCARAARARGAGARARRTHGCLSAGPPERRLPLAVARRSIRSIDSAARSANGGSPRRRPRRSGAAARPASPERHDHGGRRAQPQRLVAVNDLRRDTRDGADEARGEVRGDRSAPRRERVRRRAPTPRARDGRTAALRLTCGTLLAAEQGGPPCRSDGRPSGGLAADRCRSRCANRRAHLLAMRLLLGHRRLVRRRPVGSSPVCFDGDSLPPIPVSPAPRSRTTTSCSRPPTATASPRSRPPRRAAGRGRRPPGRARPLPLLRGAGAALRRARLRRGGDRLLRPHGRRREARRRLRVHAARQADDAGGRFRPTSAPRRTTLRDRGARRPSSPSASAIGGRQSWLARRAATGSPARSASTAARPLDRRPRRDARPDPRAAGGRRREHHGRGERRLRPALSAAGVEHELVDYEGAPHSFFDRKHQEFAAASDDAWQRTLEFVEQHS